MKIQPIIALTLCAALATPGAAQVRVAAGLSRGPVGVSVVPTMGTGATSIAPTLGGQLSAPSLNSGFSVAPVPALNAVAVPLPSAAALQPLVPAAAANIPAPKAVKSVAPLALPGMKPVAGSRNESPSVAVNAVQAVQLRSESESFWSGSTSKKALDDAAPVVAPAANPRSSLSLGVAALTPAAALPALPSWASAAVPYAEGAALIGGAYAANRAVRWTLDKIAAKRGWEKNTIATWRFVSSLVIWGGASTLGLSLAGISGSVLAETFGFGGAAMALAISLAVKDVAGNLFRGVHFLLARPYTIGDKVTVGKTTAVVRDLTLRYVVLTGEDGRDVLRTHSSLAAAPVILSGTYQTKELRLKLRKPALPHGLFRALRDAAAPTLWKPIVFSVAGIAALAFFPMLGGLAALKTVTWASVVLPYVKAGLVAFLANSIANTLSSALARLGVRYGWNPAVVTVAKLGTLVATWVIGGSFLLNAVGVSWPWVMKTLSLGGALMSIAVVDYGTAIFNAAVVFKLKPFEIGDENISIGEHTGTVVDITWQNVVLKLDDARYIIIPHSVVKDAEIKNPRKYGQRAEP